jgi:hypothetical protein
MYIFPKDFFRVSRLMLTRYSPVSHPLKSTEKLVAEQVAIEYISEIPEADSNINRSVVFGLFPCCTAKEAYSPFVTSNDEGSVNCTSKSSSTDSLDPPEQATKHAMIKHITNCLQMIERVSNFLRFEKMGVQQDSASYARGFLVFTGFIVFLGSICKYKIFRQKLQ